MLATYLSDLRNRSDVLVLALPRGGVPVGYEVAQALRATLDVFLVRKLGVPGQEELAMGAIALSGIIFLNRNVIEELDIPQEFIDTAIQREERQLGQREREYRAGRPPLDVKNKAIILVDDGLATGSSMRVAAIAVRRKSPAQIVVLVPVAAPSTCAEFESVVDRVICAVTPEPFWAVGQWYRDFSQTTDNEVRELLHRASQMSPANAA